MSAMIFEAIASLLIVVGGVFLVVILILHQHGIAELGVRIDRLTKSQAGYLGVPVEGPYKSEHYRY